MPRLIAIILLSLLAAIALCQKTTAAEDRLWKAMISDDLTVFRDTLDRGLDVKQRTSDGQTLLHWASIVWQRDMSEVVRLLIDHGADVNAVDSDGFTSLMLAAQMFRPKIAQILIDRGAKITAKDGEGNRAIHHAVLWRQYDFFIGGQEEGSAEVIRVLAKSGEDINVRNAKGATPLIIASAYRHYPSVQALVELGANVNLADKEGRRAITWPAQWGADDKFFKLLVKSGATLGFFEHTLLGLTEAALRSIPKAGVDSVRGPGGRTALMEAASNGDAKLVAGLLARGANPKILDSEKHSVLHFATGTEAQFGQIGKSWKKPVNAPAALRIIPMLIQKGAPLDVVDEWKDTALAWAVEAELKDVARLLLQHGANPFLGDTGYSSLLCVSVRNEDLDMVRLILQRANRKQLAGEHTAFAYTLDRYPRRKVIFEEFLKAGFSPHAPFPRRDTPMIWAVYQGVPAIKALLALGVSVNGRDKRGHTPIQEANSWVVFDFLRSKGADPRYTAPDGNSAMFCQDVKVVRYLLDNGVSPNQRMSMTSDWQPGMTALMHAVDLHNHAVAKLLLEHGADPTIKDKSNRDALSLAKSYEDLEMVGLLMKYGKGG